MWEPTKLLFCCSLLIFGLTGRSLAQTTYRLSKNVIPDLYDISIKPYLQSADGAKQFTFDGEVNITLHAVEPNVVLITLHKDYIDIVEGLLYDSNGNIIQTITKDDFIFVPVFDKLSVYLWTPLEVNANYTLYIKYEGQIRSGLAGVFRGTYDDINWYGITQLQRIDARTAFPCFDEPEFKAKFRMRISRPKEYSSFFNTRLISSTNDGTDRYLDQFEETPPMSTYLVAFLIADFESRGDTDFKMIMHSKFNNKTNFSYEVALKTMDAYDTYTRLPYKTLGNTIMQKAGSTRFPHNGMENWGLVIYHDSVLAHEPNYTDGWSDKQYTITILVHETAHMWFGNSVTFKWWSYFWLNEAFARYYQYFLAHEIYPEYELDKQFVVNQLHLIFETDATISTQPMTTAEYIINSPSEIASQFSSIAYAKGASIIRMIRNLMGPENFDSAIRDYLKENHLKSTIPEDLFKHLRNYWPAEQHLDINRFFYDWTEQVGYPMLTVSTTSTGEYSLSQKRFILDRDSDSSVTYTIPITYTTSKEHNFEDLSPKFYFNKTMRTLNFGNSNEDEWIIFNTQQSNYYRVFYDATLLAKLQRAFMANNHSGIHVINRANVVDDLFTYGRKGLVGYDTVFQFMEYLVNEMEYLPWYSALKGINTVHQRLTVEQQKEFGLFLFELLDQIYGQLGFEKSNDSVLDVYHRNKVIAWLCKYHHSDCNTQAQNLFHLHQAENTKPTPDFRETLYCAACRDDQTSIYNNLKEMFTRENLIGEQEKILRAMGCTRYYVSTQFEFILSDDVPQDWKTIAISNLYTQTTENVTPVFRLVTENVERVAEILGSWSSAAAVISGIADYFTTQEQLDMLNEFKKEKGSLFGVYYLTLFNAASTVQTNLIWAETYLGKLFEYLDQRNGAVTLKAAISVVPLIAALLLHLFI